MASRPSTVHFRQVIQYGPGIQVFNFIIELKEEACCWLACLLLFLVFPLGSTLSYPTFMEEDLKRPLQGGVQFADNGNSDNAGHLFLALDVRTLSQVR